MESIIRTVKDIEPHPRQWLEEAIGHRLEDGQQIVIRVLTPGEIPTPEAKAQAIADLHRLSERGTRHREELGVSESAADEAIDEAIRRVRPREDSP